MSKRILIDIKVDRKDTHQPILGRYYEQIVRNRWVKLSLSISNTLKCNKFYRYHPRARKSHAEILACRQLTNHSQVPGTDFCLCTHAMYT